MEDLDLENPLTISQSQERDPSDAIPILFAAESDHMPSLTKNSDISVRHEAMSLIVKERFFSNLDPFVGFLAVNYLDRFISRQGMPKGKPWILKLLSISCLSLAAKMMKTSFSLSDFHSEEGIIFDPVSITRMEFLILGGLKWRMRSITPFAFLDFFLSLFERNDPPLKEALKARATDIVFKSQNDIKIVDLKPSIVAASALLSASHELSPLQFPCFRTAISSCQYVNKKELLECYDLIQEVVMDGYESITFDNESSSDTPVNVLDRHFLSLESEKTHSSSGHNGHSRNPILRPESEIKRRKLNDLCCNGSNDTFHQLSQQMQRC
ncbi:hypothetical protein MRB53_022390 [Persea americana]|uniref:Uncharacterized protein n=1 Tax=Persea americana TaxID=3435 RepID=A0ACC2L6H8_PERAE|nr:hypothetical protein MRB53_022390 [Persea americana]